MGRAGRRLATAVTIALIVTMLLGASVARADGGDFDSTFGDCGVVQMAVGGGVPEITKAVVGPSGATTFVGHQMATYQQQWVGRVDANGRLDPTFGRAGVATIALSSDPPVLDIALAPDDGVFVLFNQTPTGTSTTLTLVARLTARGVKDTSFGQAGVASLGSGNGEALVVQPNGQPIVSGIQNNQRYLRRLTVSGTVDPSYSADVSDFENISAMAMQGTRLILAGGQEIGGQWTGVIRRLNAPGTIDTSFGGTFDQHDADAILPLPDGRIVLAGRGETVVSNTFYRTQMAASRRLANGAPDTSFGDANHVAMSHENANTTMTGAVALADGRVVLVGKRSPAVVSPRDVWAIEMYDAAGRLDRAFGMGGTAQFDFDRSFPVPGVGAVGHSLVVPWLPPPNGAMRVGVARFQLDSTKRGAGYVVDAYGDLWPVRLGTDPAPDCTVDGPSWDYRVARGVTSIAGKGGYVLDAYGGLHPFSAGWARPAPGATSGGPYWLGWDITRGVAALPSGKGGYVLDGWGGLHPFRVGTTTNPTRTVGGPYWTGFDIARGVALMPDGKSGFVVDGYGGLHPFATPGNPMPPKVKGGPYWYGWDIVRGVAILPDGTGGYVIDGYGGAHPFALGTNPMPPKLGAGAPYFSGHDGARGLTFLAPLAPADPHTATDPTSAAAPVVQTWRPRPGRPLGSP